MVEKLAALFPPEARGGWGKSASGGFRTEYQIKHKLEEAGYTVLRSSGSHGPFDLIAILPGQHVLGIQSKRSKEKCQSPVPAFGSFFPILIRRFPGGWDVSPF